MIIWSREFLAIKVLLLLALVDSRGTRKSPKLWNNLMKRADSNSNTIENPERTCMKKVIMISKIEYDQEIRCKQIYRKNCYDAYVTKFKQTQVEDCKEKFVEECLIDYKKEVKNHTVEICNEVPTNFDCYLFILNGRNKTFCSTQHQTVCDNKAMQVVVEEDVPKCKRILETKCALKGSQQKCFQVPRISCKLQKQNVTKSMSKPTCTVQPVRLCNQLNCDQETKRVCQEEVRMLTQDIPHKTCTINPVRSCGMVTKILPSLEKSQKCVRVPKEDCQTIYTNPRKVKRPMVKLWCGKL